MKITRVESVLYGVEDLETGIRFFDDWGLIRLDRRSHGADFALPSGQTILLRRADDPALPPPIEPGSSGREVTWGVADAASLAAVAAELSRDRPVTTDADGTIHSFDPNHSAIAFRIARPGLSASDRGPGRSDGPPETPDRIAHVVYTTTKDQGRPTSDFYVGRLQFRISDRVNDNGDFLRASGSFDHHNLFIQHRPNRLTFNHTAFEVDSFDRVLRAGQYMRDRGWQTAIEPGRHYVSSQQYWYFKNPCGGEAEYFCSDLVVDDKWQTRTWETAPRVSA